VYFKEMLGEDLILGL